MLTAFTMLTAEHHSPAAFRLPENSVEISHHLYLPSVFVIFCSFYSFTLLGLQENEEIEAYLIRSFLPTSCSIHLDLLLKDVSAHYSCQILSLSPS